MPRWIVFDQDTASELRSRLPQASVFEAPGRAALEYALNNPKSVVTVLSPLLGKGSPVAVFRPGRPLSRTATTAHIATSGAATEPAPPARPSRIRASGFLGLNDAPVLDEEEDDDEKRRWWEFWKE